MDFKPAETYELLLRQARSLVVICNSLEKQRQHWSDLCDKLTREMMSMNSAAVDAERETNRMLTNALEAAEKRIAELEQHNAAIKRRA